MVLHERGRKKLLTLMTVQEKSQRTLAEEAGWASHSYMGRLLRGQVNTLEPEAAARIATALGVEVDDLFTARITPLNAPAEGDEPTTAHQKGA